MEQCPKHGIIYPDDLFCWRCNDEFVTRERTKTKKKRRRGVTPGHRQLQRQVAAAYDVIAVNMSSRNEDISLFARLLKREMDKAKNDRRAAIEVDNEKLRVAVEIMKTRDWYKKRKELFRPLEKAKRRDPMSKRTFASKVTVKLKAVQDIVGGEIRVSAQNVPHLVFPLGDKEASVAYFARRDSYRLFYPYPSRGGHQERFNFDFPQGVTEFVNQK